jgi:hypothetical protein
VVGGQRNVAVAIVCWWSHSQPGFWLLTVASGAEWLFRGLRSGGRGLGVPLRPNPVRPTPWAYDGVPGEGSIPAPLPPPPIYEKSPSKRVKDKLLENAEHRGRSGFIEVSIAREIAAA